MTEDVDKKISELPGANPLYVAQLRRLYIDKGAVSPNDVNWYEKIDPRKIPETLEAALAERRDILDERSQRVLDVITVSRRAPSVELISSASGLPQPEIQDIIDSLVYSEFIEIDYSGEGRELYGFGSDAIKQALCASLPEEVRKTVHRRIASAIMEVYEGE